MSMRAENKGKKIPGLTAEVARAAFPKGNRYMKMRDEWGRIYDDEMFGELYAKEGQPSLSPWQMGMVTVMQFGENLTDRQAAEGVRGRIDWKYALGLELTNAGFDHSVLSEFRDRLLKGGAEGRLFEKMLGLFKEKELLNKREQRTDATHIVAAVRELNRAEVVGETLRQALNILAQVDPNWLRQQIEQGWFERYSQPIHTFRLPKGKAEREAMCVQYGVDGMQLLNGMTSPDAPAYLRQLPVVELLRQVWIQQYYVDDGVVCWRSDDQLPPHAQLIVSPYDPQARYSEKRGQGWVGYKVHLSETCDSQTPNLITHVETTVATTHDAEVIEPIQQALADKGLTPDTHFVDTAYVSGKTLTTCRTHYETDLFGPALPDTSWQARNREAYDQSLFSIDWQQQVVTCPQGQLSQRWQPTRRQNGDPAIVVRFPKSACNACSQRTLCTRSAAAPRQLTLSPQPLFEAVSQRRLYQQSSDFKQRYNARAGVEGSISQAVFSLGMRRSRFRGLAKSHFQHLATAAAINLHRVIDWLDERPRSSSRSSPFRRLDPAFCAL